MATWKALLLSSLSAFHAAGFQDVRKNFDGHRVLEIDAHLLSDELASTLRLHEADHLSSFDGRMAFKISPEGFEALVGEKDMSDETEKWISQLQETMDHPDLFCRDHHSDCAARNLDDFHTSYQSLEALTTRIGTLVDESDGLAVRNQIGSSFEGRPMHLVEIAKGDDDKPMALFMCNVHAREWLSPMYCAYMIEMLLADGGHPILDVFGFAIVPTGNPDGYVHSTISNNLWRKTRNTNDGSRCIGTDGNRNWEEKWGGDGTSDDPCSDIYCGTGPFSTPEIKSINDYAQTIADRMVVWIDFHAYGGYWLGPTEGTTGYPPEDDYGKMLYCMEASRDAIFDVHGETFEVGPAGVLLYPTGGTSKDHFYKIFGMELSYTVEMRGNSFQPAPRNIILSNEEIFAGMIAQMGCAKEIELDGVSVPPAGPPVTEPPTRCPWFFC